MNHFFFSPQYYKVNILHRKQTLSSLITQLQRKSFFAEQSILFLSQVSQFSYR